MAEEDMMLLQIKTDASGAITETRILDENFKNLSTTFRKGNQETKKLNKVMAEQVDVSKKDTKSQNTRNISYLAGLAGLEALTSASNQYISAQYKKIDADLASGKITQEQAEAERKAVKQKEAFTGRLEEVIAVLRLGTVAHMAYTSVVGLTTTATTANTAAVKANTVAWYANPLFGGIALIIGGLALLVLSLAALMEKFNTLDTIMGGVNKTLNEFKDGVQWITENVGGAAEAVGDFADSLSVSEGAKNILNRESIL